MKKNNITKILQEQPRSTNDENFLRDWRDFAENQTREGVEEMLRYQNQEIPATSFEENRQTATDLLSNSQTLRNEATIEIEKMEEAVSVLDTARFWTKFWANIHQGMDYGFSHSFIIIFSGVTLVGGGYALYRYILKPKNTSLSTKIFDAVLDWRKNK